MVHPAPSLDLFAWPAVHAAQLAVETAHAHREEAYRRFRCAPHGCVTERRQAYQAATVMLLEAERALTRAIEEA